MKRYRVLVTQVVVEQAWVEVEAETEEQAMDIAPERSRAKDVTWKFYDTLGEQEAIDIEEISTESFSAR